MKQIRCMQFRCSLITAYLITYCKEYIRSFNVVKPIKGTKNNTKDKDRLFLLVDLRDFFQIYGRGTNKKINKKALKSIS